MWSTQKRIYKPTIRHSNHDPKAHLPESTNISLTSLLPPSIVNHTSSPVQNIGHLSHGVSLALPNHVLKYGFRTARGSTGGVSTEAIAGRSSAEPAAAAAVSQCIVKGYIELLGKAIYGVERKERMEV